MKTILGYAACLFLVTLASFAFGQGALAPSGTPAPTMKTLDQLEPRTPISALPFTISNPGSYYLTANLTATANNAGITVAADNVTIDLRGFTLSGGGRTGTGINSSGTGSPKNLCVHDGTISDWKTSGIEASNVTATTFEKLRLLNNGGAISAGTGATVRACVASGNTQFVITLLDHAVVTDCNVTANSSLGNALDIGTASHVTNSNVSANQGAAIYAGSGCSIINCTISANRFGIQAGVHSSILHCTVSDSTSGFGIALGSGGTGLTISDCTVVNNNGTGIIAGIGSTIDHCTIARNAGTGLEVDSRCYVSDNIFETNNAVGTSKKAGVVVTGTGNRIDSNSFGANGFAGLFGDTSISGNIMIRNTFRGAQYILPTSNVTGPFVDLSAGGGTIPSTASPWANFGY